MRARTGMCVAVVWSKLQVPSNGAGRGGHKMPAHCSLALPTHARRSRPTYLTRLELGDDHKSPKSTKHRTIAPASVVA
jgi:hypothetical protein